MELHGRWYRFARIAKLAPPFGPSARFATSGAKNVIGQNKRTFHELLKKTREEANQSEEVMAVLLNVSPEEYQALEGWKYPDEETLKRLCLMMEWNYYDTQRLIINEMISPHRPVPPAEQSPPEPVQGPGIGPGPAGRTPPAGGKRNSLGERLREVRMITGQSTEIISLMIRRCVS